VTSYDNAWAIKQIQDGHQELLHREPAYNPKGTKGVGKNGKLHPRIITLGGDHTIVLPLLRSINSAYGPITVIHFDSHLDTWKPKVFGGAVTKQSAINRMLLSDLSNEQTALTFIGHLRRVRDFKL
jgi:agmatinase